MALARIRSGEGRCSVAVFDLDRFKSVNDGYGHAIGDLVLQTFAAVATGAVRDRDMVGRIGGEEFALILWNADATLAIRVCERIRAALAARRVAVGDGRHVAVSASAGIALLGAGPAPVRADAAERALAGGAAPHEAAELAARDVEGEHRRALCTELARRAIEEALA